MNLFKIVQKKTDKSNRKSSPYKDAVTVLLFVFLLPYVMSCLWGDIGEEAEKISSRAGKGETAYIDENYAVTLSGNWGITKMSMQEYLVRKLEIVMGEGEEGESAYEFEALKAQAVLLRTELWELLHDADDAVAIQDDVTMYGRAGLAAGEEEEETVYEKAVHETDGIFLAYGDKPIKAAFFPVSNGYTRAASEVWGDMSYPYLASVECGKDITSKDYQSRVSVSREEYARIVQGIFGGETAKNMQDSEYNSEAANNMQDSAYGGVEFTYDSAGYVTAAELDGNSCSGEAFRNAFGLNSSCFHVEWKEDKAVFHVKGLGHGFGMSQYGANERAVSGETFEQILKYYFFQTELAKIE